jgi:capsular polysaccharide biosynthesis protein
VLNFVLIETPTPTPAGVDPNLVTPGVIGFVATLVLVVATILLLLDMNRRTRRVRYRAEIAERLDAEESGDAASGETRTRDDEAGDGAAGDEPVR